MIPIFDILAPIVSKVLDYIPDAKTKAEAQLKLQQELDRNSESILAALTAVDRAQADTNTQEAASQDKFVSRWRPAIGWTCAAAFAYSYVLQPVLLFVCAVSGHPITNLPTINISEMMPVLLGMLGLAGMRSWEKYQKIDDRH